MKSILALVIALVGFGAASPGRGATATRLSVATLAGVAGTNEYVDGPRALARFKACEMIDVAVDLDGNAYLACAFSVRKITPDGTVSTLAGHPLGWGQVDGPGDTARFEGISGIAVDGAGNVYVADQAGHTIRKISPSGNVSTLAGKYREPGAADGAPAVARFTFPSSIAVTREGVIYITENLCHAVRRIAVDGTVTTFVGNREERGAIDGIGTAARLISPLSLTTDAVGNLFIATSSAIRKATPAGEVSTFVRVAGSADTVGLGGPVLQLPVQYPVGQKPTLFPIAAGPDGRIYWWDGPLCAIAPTGEASFLAGSVFYGFQDGVGADALFGYQIRLAVHDSGSVVATDPYNSCVRVGSFVEVPVPVITKQPADQDALNGTPATIAVTAEGDGPLSYQWHQVHPYIEKIAGATGASYTIPSVTLSHSRYLVKIRCGSEEISSREVEVSVGWPPQLTGGTGNGSTVTGVPVVYSVLTADPIETLTFQWQMVPNPMSLDWADLPENAAYSGVKTNLLTVKSPTLTMSGYNFRCVVTNHLGSTYSGAYILNVVRALGEWRQMYFGTKLDEGDAAGTADPDGDGLPNIMEYALSRNPKQAELDPPWVQSTQDHGNGPCLTLSFARVPDPALTYTVEASGNLSDWLPIWTSRDLPQPDGGAFWMVDTAAPMTTHERRFLRLKIGYVP